MGKEVGVDGGGFIMLEVINSDLMFSRSLSTRNNPSWIVVHHALKSTCTIEDVHRWHLSNGWSGFGYHFFVDKLGRIYLGRPVTVAGAHTPGLNQKSIGICLEGCYQEYQNQTDREVPEEQFQALLDLVLYLKKEYRVRGDHIIRHYDKHPYKLCPGDLFPWVRFKHEVIDKYNTVEVRDQDEVDIFLLSRDLLYEFVDRSQYFTLNNDLLVSVFLSQLGKESRLNPNKVNSVTGAKGIAQFLDSSWEEWGEGDPFNIRNSIEAYARYMDFLFSRFGEIPDELERLKFVLGAYSVGRQTINQILEHSRKSLGFADSYSQWVQDGLPPGNWQYWWYSSRFTGLVLSGSLGDRLSQYVSDVWNGTIQNLVVK